MNHCSSKMNRNNCEPEIEIARAPRWIMVRIRTLFAAIRMSRAVARTLVPNTQRHMPQVVKRRKENPPTKAYQFGDHAPARCTNRAPTRGCGVRPKLEPKLQNGAENHLFGRNSSNQGATHAPTATKWFLPSGMIDTRPVYTPSLYQNWCREAKLRRSAQSGAKSNQPIAQISTVFPMNPRMEISTYLEKLNSPPENRSVDAVMQLMNTRYGKTDSARAWSWLTSLAESKWGATGGIPKYSRLDSTGAPPA